ncbi:MAG: TIGR01777 family oxidoreductase [Deltaproteobacteria bacterium]|nr:TIGR01777 family oxidoreductase [Deltaproteobacteria bacterium]
MKIFITGGTGFVGSTLARYLFNQGHEVTVLTRSAAKARHMPDGIAVVEGDPVVQGPWQKRVAEHEVVINLAGRSIFTRWTKKAKRVIRDSRLLTTRHVVEAISERKGENTLLLSTSAVGYYGFHGDEELDEDSPPGDDFLATLTRQWEEAAFEAERYGVRVITCRFGIVLGRQGGALEKMVAPFRRGLGSRLGSGRQWFSWIHEQDLAAIYLFLAEKKDISGPINFTAPEPVTNAELTRILGEALQKPVFLPPVPGFLLKALMGEFGSVLLKGQKVLPRRLMRLGFQFRFSTIVEALHDLLRL